MPSYVADLENYSKKYYKLSLRQLYSYSPELYKILLLETYFKILSAKQSLPIKSHDIIELENFIFDFLNKESLVKNNE